MRVVFRRTFTIEGKMCVWLFSLHKFILSTYYFQPIWATFGIFPSFISNARTLACVSASSSSIDNPEYQITEKLLLTYIKVWINVTRNDPSVILWYPSLPLVRWIFLCSSLTCSDLSNRPFFSIVSLFFSHCDQIIRVSVFSPLI